MVAYCFRRIQTFSHLSTQQTLNRQSIQQHKTWGTTQVQTVNQGDPGLTGQVQGYIIGDYTAGVKQCAIYSPLLYNN